MSEILAPAGDKNSALAAINSGADAIYLGLKNFSARSSAENFDEIAFNEIVKYAHAFNVKVYVAMNTLVKDSELNGFLSDLLSAWNGGADAIIISDALLGAFIKRNYPEIVLHLSTQAGVCNAYGAKFAKKLGFSRVILSRETSINDIKEIASIIETEVFVQGALCTCFSGQCYLSSFAGGNSGNRGKCKQPCRKRYSIDRDGFQENAYRLSPSDLCVGEDIKKLRDAGVFSFKIEGRMRRAEYVSAAVKYYRNILDERTENGDLSDLKRTFKRGNYTKGLAFGQDKSFLSSAVQGHIGEFVGTVTVKNGKFLCYTPQKFTVGDGFKILREGKEAGGAAFGGNIKGGFILSTNNRLKNGDKVFVTTDSSLNERLLKTEKKLPLYISAKFIAGERAEITVNGKHFYGEKPLNRAQNRPLTNENIKNCFSKTDKYPYSVIFGEIFCDEIFMPTSELNALRRSVFENYFSEISKNNNKKYSDFCTFPLIKPEKNENIAVIGNNLNGISAEIGVLKLNDYSTPAEPLFKNFSGKKYIYLPPYMTGEEISLLKDLINKFDGIYCDGIYGFELAEEQNKPLFVGTGLNISNAVSVSELNTEYFALSKELTANEINALSTKNSFYLAAGSVKVMDIIYCPFEKKCKTCDKRELYTLTDENGRKFPLKRYKSSVGACRFELYNCASLVAKQANGGTLLDCSTQNDPQNIVKICNDEEKLRERFKNATRGHSAQPIN